MSLYLEVFIRFISIGVLTSVCILMLKSGLKSPIQRYAAFLNIAMICILLTGGTQPWALHGATWALPNVLANFVFAFAWLFGLALFEENFQIGQKEWLVLGIFSIPPAFYFAWFFGFEPAWLGWVRLSWLLMSLALMLHLVYKALSGRAQDLVEARRRERVRFAASISFMLIFVFAASEVFETFNVGEATSYLFIFAIPYSMWMLLWLTRFHPEALAFETVTTAPPTTSNIDPRDRLIKARLDQLMTEDKIYREQGLTIRKLAERMRVPEHQLRALINRAMGYRNFSSFLNHYRIEEARNVLADPEHARLPVLTIAMDVGYASLTPFNAAFKAIVGATPSTFRTEALKAIYED